jgi:hypothetical protein
MTNSQLTQLRDEELLSLRAKLDSELRRRKLAFSVGDVGESLAIAYFRDTPGLPALQLATPGTKNVDALSRNGERYSIKTLLNAKKTGTVYPDRDKPEKQLFEYMLVVRLATDWSLAAIYQFSWNDFVSVRSWDRRMSAWYLGCSVTTLKRGTQLFPMTPLPDTATTTSAG